ncbi:MAG: hypothetical protein ACP5OZ_04315 [Candidatus Woesearchaeota archaeon]
MKRALSILDNWIELLMFIFLCTGFLIAIISRSRFVSYAIIVVFGFLFGTLLYDEYNKERIPKYAWMFSFLIGYLIGNLFQEWKIIVTVFLISSFGSYFLYDRRIIKL